MLKMDLEKATIALFLLTSASPQFHSRFMDLVQKQTLHLLN